MRKIKAKTDEYTNDQGEKKGRYTDIGVILNNQNGDYILLDPTVNLAGVLSKQNALAIKKRNEGDANAKTGTSVMCSIFDQDRNSGSSQPAPQQQNQMPEDDIPW